MFSCGRLVIIICHYYHRTMIILIYNVNIIIYYMSKYTILYFTDLTVSVFYVNPTEYNNTKKNPICHITKAWNNKLFLLSTSF